MPRGAVGKQRGRGGPPGALSRHDACSSQDPILRREEQAAGRAPTFELMSPPRAPRSFECFLDAKNALDAPGVAAGAWVRCVACDTRLATRGTGGLGEGTNGDTLARRIFYKFAASGEAIDLEDGPHEHD